MSDWVGRRVNTLCSGLNEHKCEHILMVNTKHRSGFVVAAVSVSCSGLPATSTKPTVGVDYRGNGT